MSNVVIIALVCMFIGFIVGFFTTALLRSNGSADEDTGRIDLVATEGVFISHAGEYVIAFDSLQRPLACGHDLREVIDTAAAKLLARNLAEQPAASPMGATNAA